MVLVVDDEPLLHIIANRVLERAGFDVLNASNGLEAVELLGLATQPPILVVSDIRMPRMSGTELGQWLGTRYPAVPILYVSGFPDEFPLVLEGSAPRTMLGKPFTPDMLLEQVRRLCGQEAQAHEKLA